MENPFSRKITKIIEGAREAVLDSLDKENTPQELAISIRKKLKLVNKYLGLMNDQQKEKSLFDIEKSYHDSLTARHPEIDKSPEDLMRDNEAYLFKCIQSIVIKINVYNIGKRTQYARVWGKWSNFLSVIYDSKIKDFPILIDVLCKGLEDIQGHKTKE